MSDISALSNQYDQLAETSEKINDSVVALKKQNLLRDPVNKFKYPGLKISAEEIRAASALLLVFLASTFENLYDPKESIAEFMPVTVKNDYKIKVRKNADYLDEDLRKLHRRLKQQEPVTEDDLKLMDILVTTLDTERNNLFRKLRTARG